MVCIFNQRLKFELIVDSWVGSDHLLFWLMIRSLRFPKGIISDGILKNCTLLCTSVQILYKEGNFKRLLEKWPL